MPDNQDPGAGQDNQDQGAAAAAAKAAADKAAADAAAAAGKGAPVDFKSSLPEELRSHPAADKFKSTGEVFKSYVELEKLVGLEKIPLPKKDKDGKFDSEGVKGVMQRLGMPKDPAGYDLTKVKIPEGLKTTEESIASLKGVYHKFNLLPHQAEGVTQFMMETLARAQTDQAKQGETERQEAETELRKEWGSAYAEKISLAKKAMHAFADENDQSYIDQGLGNDLRLIKVFARIGEQMSEDQLANAGILETNMTPAQAQAEISKIRNDKAHPFHSLLHPEHLAAVEYMNQLYRMAHPEPVEK